MPLESSDINDKDILAATRQETNSDGHIRFKYKFPSGRTVHSEWMNRENVKASVLMDWANVIRSQLVADAEAEAEEKAAQARRARRDADMSAGDAAAQLLPGLVKPTAEPAGPATSHVLAVPATTAAPMPIAQTTSGIDPISFVRAQKQEAERSLGLINSQIQELLARSAVLQTQVAQWTRLEQTMAAPVNPVPDRIVIP